MNNLNERIENFLQLVNQNMHNHYRKNFPTTYSETSEDHQYVVADTGRKFLRIASTDRDGNIRSVYCFIALTDGNTKSMGSYSTGDIMNQQLGRHLQSIQEVRFLPMTLVFRVLVLTELTI